MLQHSVPFASQKSREIQLVKNVSKKKIFKINLKIEVNFQILINMLIHQIFTSLLQLEPKTQFPENHSSR